LGFTGLSKAEQNQIHPIPIHEFMYLRFVDAVCGNDHVVALTREGEIYCFGDGEQGQLGRKLLQVRRHIPHKSCTESLFYFPPTIQRRKGAGLQPEGLHMTKFVVIGSGAYHSFGVHEDGGVYAWGLNSCNQTGVSSSSKNKQEVLFRPEEVVALSPEALGGGRRVVSISGGEHHSLFLLSDGSVWGCGRCDGAELGLPKDHPAMADIIAKRTKKGDINRAINGEYLAAPAPLIFPPPPSAGDLAPALPAYATLSDPYSTAPLDPITWISAGTRHNLAVSRSGSVYSWGYGNTYQLGLGVGVDAAEAPTRVRSLKMNDFHVESAAAGGQHCLLLARKIVVEAENVGANA
jgi:regulator of chromosome condensation